MISRCQMLQFRRCRTQRKIISRKRLSRATSAMWWHITPNNVKTKLQDVSYGWFYCALLVDGVTFFWAQRANAWYRLWLLQQERGYHFSVHRTWIVFIAIFIFYALEFLSLGIEFLLLSVARYFCPLYGSRWSLSSMKQNLGGQGDFNKQQVISQFFGTFGTMKISKTLIRPRLS